MAKKNRALKVFSSITASTIVATSLFAGSIAGGTSAPQTVSAATKVSGPVDLGIANDERLIEMLKKEGKLAKDASPAEADKALTKYLKAKSQFTKTKDSLPQGLGEPPKSKKTESNGLKNGNGNKLGQAKKNTVDPVENESYDGEVRSDKVLVLAIDFPDYEKSSITKEETDMWYEDYTHEHFQNMIFGENGYEGPNGENFISMKQYFEQQSGGSYTVDGTVAGWYTADNPAAYYGGNYPDENGSDARPRTLVYEALTKAGQDPNVDLSEYDVWDRDDYDGDGVYNEPDGIIDHLMVIHAGVGEEAGGGSLGGDAIWSHRWNLGNLVAVPGGSSNSDRFGGLLGAYDYTIEPEDGAAGVFTHEFGHDLGLPDEYDTVYSGAGEAVAYWSLMSSGSWAGDVPGTEPPGMSPYAKEMLQALHDGNWLSGSTLNYEEDITSEGTTVLLDEGVTKGTNNDAVRIDLPEKLNVMNTPKEGSYEYYGGKGDEIDHKMVTTFDLTGATNATLDFDAWYNIEKEWDYAMVQVSTDGGKTWESLSSDRTTSTLDTNGYPAIKENLPGYTGSSNGWIHETIDLSNYAGQEIQLQFRSMTDWATNLDGFFADNIKVTADGNEIFYDGAENEPLFTLDGFEKHDGKYTTNHYYLLEWRSHNGVDEGLKNIRRGNSLMSYDPGLVVWYVDESYDNNWTGVHPGDGFLGVVDADQHANYWSDNAVGSTRYQLHDAAFGLEKTEKMSLDYTDLLGVTMKDNFTKRNPLFDDSADYSNAGLVDAGRKVPNNGLKFRVTGQSDDGTVGKVLIYK
ncbi:immune inhibitor A [Bacillus sp. ISL-47]|uniref:immune inhibitor A domain-containing protein n=1 Tax=Bacillus sp. ISL-47 TaxID=2819130 RepID=UPI001BEC5140|nr:immune inhibitor A domain-containing protein [Bacillus sp. ISL-47]MBT2687311.1 immune inhibitor A [Bacillus sp. ISL-47]MBT2706619.1 immune inhibitor A [Pseudomonas sp. ISL-84]